MKTNIICLALAAAPLFFSCSDSNSWKVEGNLRGAEGQLLTLEASNNGNWYQLDTLTLGADGKFSFSSEAAGYPDIYRLRVGSESIYFPVDSIETLKVEATAPFGSSYTLSGTEDAENFMKVNALIDESVRKQGEMLAASDPALKKELAEMAVGNPASLTAYYIINKKIGSAMLFNPAVKADVRVIGAVANAFHQNRPGDPRTPYLTALFLNNRQSSGSSVEITDTISASVENLIEIELLNPAGKPVSLRDEAAKGKVIVLNFTSLTAEQSPAFNLELGKVYDAYKGRGMEIYQVAIDPDEFAWKTSAKNLPWISVYANPHTDARVLTRYNVTNIPTTFIINRQGELSERVTDITKLGSSVQKYL